MRKFLVNIVKLMALVFIMAFAGDRILDIIFVEVSKRGSIYSAIKTNQIKKPELLVIGNSRVAYNIVPKILEETLPFHCYNLGFSAANPVDLVALIELYSSLKGFPKVILVQLDDTFTDTLASELARQIFLPYYHHNILAHYYPKCEDERFYNLPLFRYMKYRDISWREGIKIAVNNKPQDLNSGEISYIKRSFSERRKDRISQFDLTPSGINDEITVLQSLCRANNIELVFFTSPVYSLRHNSPLVNYFKSSFANYIDQSTLLVSKDHFADYTHVNEQGAILQSKDLADRLLVLLESQE